MLCSQTLQVIAHDHCVGFVLFKPEPCEAGLSSHDVSKYDRGKRGETKKAARAHQSQSCALIHDNPRDALWASGLRRPKVRPRRAVDAL